MLRTLVAIVLLASSLTACERTTAPVRPLERDKSQSIRSPLFGDAYAVTVLPFIPAGINDLGVIAGTSGSVPNPTDAVTYYNGVMTTLPRVPGLGGQYEARGINNSGSVIGTVQGGPGLYWPTPNATPMQILGSPLVVEPSAINNFGAFVGTYRTPNFLYQAFRDTAGILGGLVITPPLFQDAWAVDVNDSGTIVGYGRVSGGPMQALRWRRGALNPTMLGAGMALAIRSNGDIVGVGSDQQTPVMWTAAGVLSQLPVPAQSLPEDISSQGRIVGRTLNTATVNPHQPWTYLSGSPAWLPLPNLANTFVIRNLRVNRCGSIVGTQILTNGTSVGLLWTKLTCDGELPIATL